MSPYPATLTSLPGEARRRIAVVKERPVFLVLKMFSIIEKGLIYASNNGNRLNSSLLLSHFAQKTLTRTENNFLTAIKTRLIENNVNFFNKDKKT